MGWLDWLMFSKVQLIGTLKEANALVAHRSREEHHLVWGKTFMKKHQEKTFLLKNYFKNTQIFKWNNYGKHCYDIEILSLHYKSLVQFIGNVNIVFIILTHYLKK